MYSKRACTGEMRPSARALGTILIMKKVYDLHQHNTISWSPSPGVNCLGAIDEKRCVCVCFPARTNNHCHSVLRTRNNYELKHRLNQLDVAFFCSLCRNSCGFHAVLRHVSVFAPLSRALSRTMPWIQAKRILCAIKMYHANRQYKLNGFNQFRSTFDDDQEFMTASH